MWATFGTYLPSMGRVPPEEPCHLEPDIEPEVPDWACAKCFPLVRVGQVTLVYFRSLQVPAKTDKVGEIAGNEGVQRGDIDFFVIGRTVN